MQLGFVSAILPDLSLEEVFTVARDLRFDTVELMCWPRGAAERRYAGVTHLDVAHFSAAEADRVRSLAKHYGVSISALGYYPNPLVADEAEATVYIEHLKKVISASAQLGVGIANTFIGRDHRRSLADNWAIFDERWPEIVSHAEREGARIGIENCPMFFSQDEWPGGKNLASSPRNWRELFRRQPSPALGLNYDPSHLVWQMMDHLAPLHEFAERIYHIHAKDVRIDRQKLNSVGTMATPLEYHCPKLPGLGEIEWGRFISHLGDSGYRGPVCIEVEDRAFEDSLSSRQAALRQSGAFLRNFISS